MQSLVLHVTSCFQDVVQEDRKQMSLETNPSHPVNPLGHRLPPPGLCHHVKASLGRRDSIMVSPSETYPLDSQNTEHRICNNHFIICRSTSLPLSVDRSMCAASPKQTGRSNVLCATQRTKDKLSLDLDSNWIGRALLLASPVQTWLSVSV